MNLQEQLKHLSDQARAAIRKAQDLAAIEALEVKYLGRKGELTAKLKDLSTVPAEDRPKIGTLANEIKMALERDLSERKAALNAKAVESALDSEREDVTEPGTRPPEGHLHLVTLAIREIQSIFERAGFVRVRYPEVDWDTYAFENLNMPADHPARDEWETFFMDAPVHPNMGKMILTPHATNGTARILEEMAPALKKGDAIRAINIAKTYRRQIDMTHVPMFHQFDGVFLDKGVNLTHLLGILDYFVKSFFGAERKVRIRPFHFRFTEPSFEVDVSCGVCGGTGKIAGGKCRTCKHGWLELGGAGMLHPNVLKAANIDPETYSGLAFGWGVERTYMMKSGLTLDDIRTLYKNDLRFLQQF